jgi:predicted CopG family antitoxin
MKEPGIEQIEKFRGKHINVFSKCIDYKSGGLMVKVITIMDDVYAELHRLKKSKGMSFTEVLRFLLKERRSEKTIINLAGSIDEKDISRTAMERIRRQYDSIG